MVGFAEGAPQINPQEADEFRKYPHSIDNQPANKAQEEVLGGITQVFTKGVPAADKFGQDFVKDRTREGIDPVQQKFVGNLESEYNQTFPKTADTLTPTANADDNIPGDIKAGMSTVYSSKAAREQGGLPGHLRDTEYDKAIWETAQKLRSQYPGYRDYVDREIERVTGRSPTANQYIKDMQADLNEAYNKKNESKNKLISGLATHIQLDGVHELINGVQSGAISEPEGWRRFHGITAFIGQEQKAKADLEIMNRDQKFDQNRGRYVMAQAIPDMAHLVVQSAVDQVFPGGDFSKATSEDWIKLNQLLHVGEIGLDRKIDQRYGPQKDSKGRVIDLGIKQQMAGEYDKAKAEDKSELAHWLKITEAQDGALGASAKHAFEAYKDQSSYDLLKGHGRVNDFFRAGFAGKQLLPNAFNWDLATIPGFEPPSGTPDATGKRSPSKDEEEMKALFGSAAKGINLGGIKTMPEALGLIHSENKRTNSGFVGSTFRHIKNVMDGIRTTSTVSDADAERLVAYAFGPNTGGWINNLNNEVIGKDGKPNVGKHEVFGMVGDPDNVARIRKLGGEAWRNYQAWTADTFNHDIISPDLKYIQQLPYLKGADLIMHLDKTGARPTWLEFRPGGNPARPGDVSQPKFGIEPYSAERVNLEIQKINSAIKAYHNVVGERANGEFLSLLHKAQVDTSGPRVADSTFDHIYMSLEAGRSPIPGSPKPQAPLSQWPMERIEQVERDRPLTAPLIKSRP